ncbi:MAG: HAD family hydrolase, partial [Bacillota bacterium]
MLKNIVFDLGKVLIEFNPEKYLIDLGYNGKKAKRIIKAIFNSREWIELDRGTIDEKEAADKMIEYDPDLADEIKDVMTRWYNILSVREETLEILKMIDKNRFNLFVLSN